MKALYQRYYDFLIDALMYTTGCTLYAVSVSMFSAPNHMIPSGLYGLSTLINYLFGLPIGMLTLCMNIPLLVLAWRKLGHGFVIRTAVVVTLSSAIVDLTDLFVPPYFGDKLLVALFGGILSGIGLGMIYMRKGSTGGMEIPANLLRKSKPHLPIGRLIFLTEGAVLIAAAFVYRNLDSALYSIVRVFTATMVLDAIQYGRVKGKMLLIITDKASELIGAISETTRHGVTKVNAMGGFSGEQKQMLLCAVKPYEVNELRQLLYRIDPQVFTVVLPTDMVLGTGYHQMLES